MPDSHFLIHALLPNILGQVKLITPDLYLPFCINAKQCQLRLNFSILACILIQLKLRLFCKFIREFYQLNSMVTIVDLVTLRVELAFPNGHYHF